MRLTGGQGPVDVQAFRASSQGLFEEEQGEEGQKALVDGAKKMGRKESRTDIRRGGDKEENETKLF